MGAGKSTLGAEVADRLGRPFVDLDDEIERVAGRSIPELFEAGEPAFRAIEEGVAASVLRSPAPLVVALGGGAVLSERTRQALREAAITVRVDVDADEAWERVAGGDRPLAQDADRFRVLYEERRPIYERVADAAVRGIEDVVLAAAGIEVEAGVYQSLSIDGPFEVVADEHVAELHPVRLDAPLHVVPAGERAKTLATCERLWRSLRLGRDGVIVAVGGGSTTDVAGFTAASYLRGISWIAVPTTLVGQVDAAIGGKTGVDIPEGKNLVGAFHWPERTVIDPDLLATLPETERRNGLAEVVKTGLLLGEALWELPVVKQVWSCAAFKAAVCLRDPQEVGERAMLNLGHTFAHALEAASDYALSHGEAVALGLVAALRLSGLEEQAAEVEALLAPERPPVDRERAWQALTRDKKAVGGRVRLVLLAAPGSPMTGVELGDAEVRAALDSLIA